MNFYRMERQIPPRWWKEEHRRQNMPAFPMRVVEQDGKHAVLRIKLDTGRHHQIRVQLAHAGMPIVGDKSTTSKKTLHRRADSLHCALLRSRSGIRKRIENWSLKLTKPFGLS